MMRFPRIDTNSNQRATIDVFKGINRLPIGESGEGDYINLCLDDYPTASTCTMAETKKICVYNDNGTIEQNPEGMQCIAELTPMDDDKCLLTGVCGGNFYFEGKRIEYATDMLRIKADDKVTIKKLGTRYIIHAFSKNSSATFVYNEEGTSTDSGDKQKDGKLQSDIISNAFAVSLPTAPNMYGYLFKMSGGSDSKVYRLERFCKKSYFMLVVATDNPGYKESFRSTKHYQAIQGIRKYIAMTGTQIKIVPKPGEGLRLDESMYCFDDGDSLHPIRFIEDAAGFAGADGQYGGGVIKPFEELVNLEKQKHPEIENIDVATMTMDHQMAISAAYPEAGASIGSISFTEEGAMANYWSEFDYKGGDFSGIIGHFEVWNEQMKRYEPYYGDEPPYKVIDSNGNDASGRIGISGGYKYINAIGVSFGMMNESARLEHITTSQNRTVGAVADGSMIMYSALGEYTNFSKYEGTAADSGFLSTSTPGKYTGICEYSGSLIAFKKDCMAIYYAGGNSFVFSREIKGVGCIDADSICEVSGVLIFLAGDGFYTYTGGMPQRISRKLNKTYSSARAYCDGTRYIAEAYDGTGYDVLMYDTAFGAWVGLDIGARTICTAPGGFYDDQKRLLRFFKGVGAWRFETMDLFDGIIEDKGINEIYIRARLSGDMTVTTVADDECAEHKRFTDNSGKVKIYRVPVRLKHKNYYRIRVEGEGECTLYSIERKVYAGGRAR